MRRVLETAVLVFGTLGWWGFVYPELSVTTGACEVIQEDAEKKETEVTKAYEDMDEFLNGDGKIRIKFRTVEYLYQVKEKAENKKDSEND